MKYAIITLLSFLLFASGLAEAKKKPKPSLGAPAPIAGVGLVPCIALAGAYWVFRRRHRLAAEAKRNSLEKM